MGRFGSGQAARRVEDERFLTGTGRFTDDIVLPRQAAAVVVRSPHAHADIAGIDTAAALAAPGVLGAFTAADLAADGIGALPVDFQLRDMTPPPGRPVLASGRVRHVGAPVAFVVAETLDQARDAAELVRVDYRPLPAVAEVRAAMSEGAPQLWDDLPGNVAFDWQIGDSEAVAAGFARAAHVVALDLVNNRLAPTPLEPRGAIGEFDAGSGRLTLRSGSQGSHTLRRLLAHVFDLPAERLRVVSPDVGGGFGLRLFLFAEHVLVLWAARRLGRPVKWVADRAESFLADTHGRDHVSHGELALDGDGRFLALRVSTLANLGAHVSQDGVFIPTLGGTRMLAGAYTTPAVHARVRGVLTNTGPVDAYRGAGRPEANYLLERIVDLAARRLGLSPAEIRRRNFIPPEAMPYRTALGHTYDSGEFTRNLDDAMGMADWQGFESRRAEARRRGMLRGIGLATYIESCGGGGDEAAEVRLHPDGTAEVLIGTQSSGQGHETAYAQMVASALDLPLARVRVLQGDTDRVSEGKGTGGSRSLPVGGAALAAGLEALTAKARRQAAQVLEAAEDSLILADGGFAVAGTNRFVSLADLVRLAGEQEGLEATGRFKPPSSTFPNGCHVCEVEIDPETGAVEIVGYAIADDFGVVMNPLLLAGQVHGGTAQGIGQALHEGVVYDPSSGQLLSGTLMDYALPRAEALPAFALATNEVPCRTNPLGVKGAGEAGAIGAPPAVINAVVDALAHLGIEHVDMPATPLKLWRLIRENGGGAA